MSKENNKLDKIENELNLKIKKIIEPSPEMKKLIAPNRVINNMDTSTKRLIGTSSLIEPTLAEKTLKGCVNTLTQFSTALKYGIETPKWKTNISNDILHPLSDTLLSISTTKIQSIVPAIVKLEGLYTECFKTEIKPMIMNWFKDGVVSPIIGALSELSETFKGINANHFNEVYLHEMYYSKWFPYAGWNTEISFMSTILSIIDNTPKSKKKVKEIDAAIFKYYNKTEIEKMRKSWITYMET